MGARFSFASFGSFARDSLSSGVVAGRRSANPACRRQQQVAGTGQVEAVQPRTHRSAPVLARQARVAGAQAVQAGAQEALTEQPDNPNPAHSRAHSAAHRPEPAQAYVAAVHVAHEARQRPAEVR